MLEEKVAKSFTKVAQKVHTEVCFFENVTHFKVGQNVTKLLGYFCKKSCCQHISKVAQ